MSNSNYPKHIALILDGNRRWAREQGIPQLEGHKKGFDNMEVILESARNLGIECITCWAFSTENWNRSDFEVNYLFDIFRTAVDRFTQRFYDEKIRFVHLGRKTKLPKDILNHIQKLEEGTKDFKEHTVALALDYGGHDELIRTFEKIRNNNLEINKENIEKNLDTASLPPIDLIIRTGGNFRLSGFMSWQCAYAEYYFTDTYFPGFTPEELKKACDNFSQRERRFGGDSKKK